MGKLKITKQYYEILPRRQQQQTLPRRKKVELTEIRPPCTLFLDQASSTGFSLYDSESRIVMSGVLKRGRMSLYDYKVKLVEYILDLVDTYKVNTIFHEEVYDDMNMVTTETLFYLKHAIKDIEHENAEKGIKVMGLAHRTWKTLLSKPDKFNFNSKDDKKEVRKWVGEVYPLLTLTAQDEYDAIGMGIAIMINERGKKNYYKWAKYNKRLPVHIEIYPNILGEDIEDNEERVKKMKVAYRRGFAAGGMHELELDRRREVTDSIRRFLSHVDGLVYIKIPKDYKYWGVLLLMNGKNPKEFDESDGNYILLAARKNRK